MKKKLLMIGPGQRHNIKPFLDYFQQENTTFALTFLSTGRFYFNRNEYSNIEIQELKKNPLSVLFFLRLLRNNFDLIWYHGAYHWPLTVMIFLFKKKKTRLNLNIWGERIPRLAKKDSLIGKFYNWALRKADFVQCNWFGTEEITREAQSEANTYVQPWGLHTSYFDELTAEDSYENETNEFVSNLAVDKINFFFPKALNNASRHDLLVSAAAELVSKGVDNFCIYFWLGRVDPDILRILKNQIDKEKVSDQVKIVKMPFLPFKDMKFIWTKMDCGLQIVDHDQLSTTVIEPMYMRKDIIISCIRPYQILNEKYDLSLELVDNNVSNIARAIKKIINGKTTSRELLESRKKIIESEFNFYQNLEKMISYYHKELEKYEA